MFKKLLFGVAVFLSIGGRAYAGFSLSGDYGVIQSQFKGKEEKLVFIIKDDPGNLTVQNNIFNILNKLVEEYTVKFIGVEGFAGNIDTSVFNAFPQPYIKRFVSYHFLSKGLISAAEYFAVNKQAIFMLYGLEYPGYYEEFLKLNYAVELAGEDLNEKQKIAGAGQEEYSELLTKRSESLVENFLYQITSKETDRAILVTADSNLEICKAEFEERNISYFVIAPLADPERVLAYEEAFLECAPDLKLLRKLSVRVSLFEYERFRVAFMNEYLAKLLMFSLISKKEQVQLLEKWKSKVKELITRKKEFFRNFFIEQEKEILSEELYSLFNILNTQEKEFEGLIDDIKIHPRVEVSDGRTPAADEFFYPVSFLNIKKILIYYFFKDTFGFRKIFFKKPIYKLENFDYVLLTAAEFVDLIIQGKNRLLPGREVLEDLEKISKWTFLNIFQKEYLLLKEIVPLGKILKEIDSIVSSIDDYNETKRFGLEKRVVSFINCLGEIFIAGPNEDFFYPKSAGNKFEAVKESMLKTVLCYLELFRLNNSNQGSFDLIVGDIMHKYENSIKDSVYGERRIKELKEKLSLKAQLLSEKILQENNIFGFMEHLSRWLFKRLKNEGRIDFGGVQEGLIKAGDLEYDLTAAGIRNNEKYFLQRVESYANALGEKVEDFCDRFDFSRLRFNNLNSAQQISFVFAAAYLQKKAKELGRFNFIFRKLALEAALEFRFLLFDVGVFERGIIDDDFINALLTHNRNIFVFSLEREEVKAISDKLIYGGFLENDLDNEITSAVEIVDLKNEAQGDLMVIENKEDIVARVISGIIRSKKFKRYMPEEKIFLFLLKDDLSEKIQVKSSVLERIYFVEEATLIKQLLSELISRKNEGSLQLLYNRLNYSKYEIKYLLENGDASVVRREPRTKFLLDLLLKTKDSAAGYE